MQKLPEHPNIVQYLGIEPGKTRMDIFLEYIPGGSIENFLMNHGRFDGDTSKFFTKQILTGLDFLHSHGIIHGALRADKVLVDPTGLCKLGDFGVSKFCCTGRRERDISGTYLQNDIYWMAPEYIYGNSFFNFNNLTSKADLWSLGCVLYAMWSGNRPWSNMEPNGVKKMLVAMAAPPLGTDISVDEEGRRFAGLCFIPNPDYRASASQLIEHPYLQLPSEWSFNPANIGSRSNIPSLYSATTPSVLTPHEIAASESSPIARLFSDSTAKLEDPPLWRPKLEEIYEKLDQFFPDHDLDQSMDLDRSKRSPDNVSHKKTIRSCAAEVAKDAQRPSENIQLWTRLQYSYGNAPKGIWWKGLGELPKRSDHLSAPETSLSFEAEETPPEGLAQTDVAEEEDESSYYGVEDDDDKEEDDNDNLNNSDISDSDHEGFADYGFDEL